MKSNFDMPTKHVDNIGPNILSLHANIPNSFPNCISKSASITGLNHTAKKSSCAHTLQIYINRTSHHNNI